MFLDSELGEPCSLLGIVTRPQSKTTRELCDFRHGQRSFCLPLCPDQLFVVTSALFQWITMDCSQGLGPATNNTPAPSAGELDRLKLYFQSSVHHSWGCA
jgi:hypothetical protein